MCYTKLLLELWVNFTMTSSSRHEHVVVSSIMQECSCKDTDLLKDMSSASFRSWHKDKENWDWIGKLVHNIVLECKNNWVLFLFVCAYVFYRRRSNFLLLSGNLIIFSVWNRPTPGRLTVQEVSKCLCSQQYHMENVNNWGRIKNLKMDEKDKDIMVLKLYLREKNASSRSTFFPSRKYTKKFLKILFTSAPSTPMDKPVLFIYELCFFHSPQINSIGRQHIPTSYTSRMLLCNLTDSENTCLISPIWKTHLKCTPLELIRHLISLSTTTPFLECI